MISASNLLLATALLFIGQHQGLAAPQDDPDYKIFESQIQSEKFQAEYKLNLTRETFENNTRFFNIPEFDKINSTLTQCFNEAKTNYSTTADPDCMNYIDQDVQQTIIGSQKEVEACTNLTHSWELISQLLGDAEEAITSLDEVVNKILTAAANCVVTYPYNQNFKYHCFKTAYGTNSANWANATSLALEAYYQISGGGLLLGAEVTSCQNAENFSFEKKCTAIFNEIQSNCVKTPQA